MPNKGVSWKHCMWVKSDNQSVADFCREHNLNYKLVHNWIMKLNDVDEACEMALKRKGRKDNNTKYWIEGKSLARYCKEKGINYNSMYRRIRNEKNL